MTALDRWMTWLLDRILRLLPGSRFNPDSLEARVRRNWGTYNRARDRATKILRDASEHQLKIEQEITAEIKASEEALNLVIEGLEQDIQSTKRRIKQIRRYL
jgi:hypothetical protein